MPSTVLSSCRNWKIYGNPDSEILVSGHSHTFSMYLALMNNSLFQERIGIIAQADFSSHRQQDETYWQFVKSLHKDRNLVISWNGNQHNIHFLLKTDAQFKCLGLNEDTLAPTVPLSQIEALFKPTFDELEMLLNDFSMSRSTLLLGTPAPKTKEFLDKHLNNDPFFTELGKNLGLSKKQLRATENNVRAYMWQFTQKMTRQICAKRNLSFLSSPAISYNEEFILKPEYYAEDLTHTNQEYGNLVLNELIKHFGI